MPRLDSILGYLIRGNVRALVVTSQQKPGMPPHWTLYTSVRMHQLPSYLQAGLVTPAMTAAMRSPQSFTDLTPQIARASQAVWWVRLGDQPPESAVVAQRSAGHLQPGVVYYARHTRDLRDLPTAEQLLLRRYKTDLGARLQSFLRP